MLLLKDAAVWFLYVCHQIAASVAMSTEGGVSSTKKAKDRIQQLSELRRGLIHYTDAQYGTSDDPLFVMHIVVDGIVSNTHWVWIVICRDKNR